MTAVSGRQHRRAVSVGAVGGVLAQRGGRWVVDNDSEVQLLEALRGESGARDRLWALAATLDAGVVEAGHLRRLNGRLSAIVAVERPEDLWRVRVPGNLLGAAAYVCVCANEEMLSRWLGFALAARLGANLVRGLLPGPGWVAWNVPHRRRWVAWDRDQHWIAELPESFWSRLAAHKDERLRAAAAASDPAAQPRVLERLADEHREVPEVVDLVASNPKTPTRVLRRCGQVSWGWPRTDLRVAQNRSATAGLLGELAKSPDWELRYVAAWHPKAPVSALRRLARDEFHQVRAAVACAASTPTEPCWRIWRRIAMCGCAAMWRRTRRRPEPCWRRCWGTAWRLCEPRPSPTRTPLWGWWPDGPGTGHSGCADRWFGAAGSAPGR